MHDVSDSAWNSCSAERSFPKLKLSFEKISAVEWDNEHLAMDMSMEQRVWGAVNMEHWASPLTFPLYQKLPAIFTFPESFLSR